MNLSGRESFLELHLGLYRLDYSPKNLDEPLLLAAMLDQQRPLERRLMLAAFLLDLNNDEARQFVGECLSGKHGEEAKQDATFAVAEPGLTWREEKIVELLTLGARKPYDDAAWGALCRRAGELKMEAAVEPLIAVLRRRPNDGEAALALGEIGDRRAIPILMKTIESEGGIQPFHVYALRDLQAPGLPDILIRQLTPRGLEAASNDLQLGPDGIVSMLGDLGAKEAVAPLEQLLKTSTNEELNGAIRITLARLTASDRKDLAERLLRLAETAQGSSERWSALQRVGETGQRWAVPRLVRIVQKSTDSSVIHNAISEIGELGGNEAVAGLVELLDYDFSHVPRSEMESKGRLATNFNPLVCDALGNATGEDFGRDPAAWHRYLKEASH